MTHGVCSTLAAALFCVAFGLFAEARQGGTEKPEKFRVYIGTYTEAKNPSFLAVHPSRKFLYAVSEGDGKTGGISAYAIDPNTGNLTVLNAQSSGGAGPCHLIVDSAGKDVLAANYNGGSCCCIPIKADGSLAQPTEVIQHKGSSVNKARQEGPHAHSINLDAKNRFAFCADLGLDKVLVYRFDAAKGTLTPNNPPAFDTAPGSGPRHFAFHPDGKTAYINGELDMTITACDYDADKGVLTKTQTLSTLPTGADRKGASTAEVVVHPSGKFVYVSNRGHNSIAIFAIDSKTRALTAVGHQSHKISTPRNFAIEPTGQYLLVANQSGDSVVSFRIDANTGELSPTGSSVEVPAPVCVRFVPIAK